MKRINFITVSLVVFSLLGFPFIATGGAYKETVYQAQKRLKELGYNPGSLDGSLGKNTESAVKNFQRDKGLPVTGDLDEKTKEALGLKEEQPTKVEAKTATQPNRAPTFPRPFRFNIETNYKYDNVGRLMGGVSTLTILTPAIHPDGNPLTYTWEGTEVDHHSRTTFKSRLKYDGLKATWDRTIIYGELASAMITVTASDNKGRTAKHQFCIGNRVQC